MLEITTKAFSRQSPRFDMTGQFLGYPLKECQDEAIDKELAQRLAAYAEKRLSDIGLLPPYIAHCEVSTSDAEDEPEDRWYQVAFVTTQNGMIKVHGILIKDGWPHLDHGIEVHE